ncbi:FAD-dependent oxidoreductase [Oscillatoria amoena NRMC-F 0135]|nr:FAD-dependent oxidoreductase [Oscillatoria amoena NRMC-F 0135]
MIGGGSAGYAAARTAREHTDSVAIIDGARELSGLCILRGCMPSKTLIYSAEVLHLAQKGKVFGLDIPEAAADMRKLHERKLRVIGEFADYRRQQITSGRFDFYASQARFISPDEVELADGTRLRGRKFFISTGSVVSVPPVPGLANVPFWTSDDVLDLDYMPESVIVLGGGVVACELTQFLSRIGARVTQIQRSEHILKETTPEAATVIESAFRDEGINLFTGTKIEKVTFSDGEFSVSFQHGGKLLVQKAKHLLNALGREAATKSLNLEAAGVSLKPNGQIAANEFQHTSSPNVYAGGDCAGPYEIVHIAIQQGETAARHALERPTAPMNYDHLLSVVFTDPQVALCGVTERGLREKNIPFVAASYPFDDHGKSILMEAKRGFVKVIGEARTGKLLGAEIVGKDAGELIHIFSTALILGATAGDLLKAPWYHPTLAEIVTYPLEEIVEKITPA